MEGFLRLPWMGKLFIEENKQTRERGRERNRD